MRPLVWHEATIDEVLEHLEADRRGLSEAEAKRRLERDGPNRLSEHRGPSTLRKLLRQFLEPLVLVLIVAAVVSAVLGDHVDAIVIAAVVVINALIGFFQEQRAEHAIAALDELIVSEATVVRDGAPRRVPSEQLVVGDIVRVHAGDAVSADLRLLEVRDLQVDEAALTGESTPVPKSVEPVPADTYVGDRSDLAFAGTAVTRGQATGVVVVVGDDTETGQIAGMVASAETIATPLTRRIAALSRTLVWLILAVASAMFALESVRGAALVETFNAAVALAVAAIPEGLPAAVTVLLAVGVSTMAKRRALIRRLPAVETLGSTTVICSDKTGTFTKNEMTVTRLVVGEATFEVTGEGYAPEGALQRDGEEVELDRMPAVVECLRAGALCNDTRVRREGDEATVEGDPTEAALLVVAEKVGLDADRLEQTPRVDVVPFESEHMYMATLHRSGDGRVVYVKGSSEVLLERCVDAVEVGGETRELDAEAVGATVDRLAAAGLRVLLVARRQASADAEHISHDDVNALTLLGIVGMLDPPRPAVKPAVRECREAGLLVKMITGDHAVTAAAIAADLGLEGARDDDGALKVVTGKTLERLKERALADVAEDISVFARVAPEQKLRLVQALQQRGHVVAMTGDGVNDAPALKQADIGVAMGKAGTDVARGASAMVLTDDDFATIVAAVEEGRGVYDNLVKFVAWTLPTNGGEALVLLIAVTVGTALPVVPVQVLWINMATTLLLGLALVFEPKEPGLMQRPPRPVKRPILDRYQLLRIAVVSALIAAAAFGFFELAQARGEPIEVARTAAVNTIVVAELAYLFACRSLRLPIWQLGVFSNPWVWLGAVLMLAAQLLFTYVPLMNTLFHSAPLAAWWWGLFTAAGLVIFAAVELKKLISRKRADDRDEHRR